MPSFIDPPTPLPWLLRPLVWLAEKISGKALLPARLLAWYPKAAVGSGLLEVLIAAGDDDGFRQGRELSPRLLKLARLRASFTIACPFCVDMNGAELQAAGVSAQEFAALQHDTPPEEVPSFSDAERAALAYVRSASQTPLQFDSALIEQLRQHFTPRQMVILASTAAQVNYWGRLIQALGVAPVGFCELPSEQTPQP